MSQQNLWIDNYSEAIKNFTYNHDPASHQPFDAFLFYPYYFDLWLDKIYQAIARLKIKGISEDEIFSKVPSYSSLRFIFYAIVNMTAYLRYPKFKAKIIINFFYRYFSSVSRDTNIFHEERILLKEEKELRKILASIKKIKSQAERQTISSLVGTLLMYNHLLYNDYSIDYGYFVEGPYKLDGHIILIRNYPDLAPKELWGSLGDKKSKNKQIVTVYKDMPIKMQYMSSHLIAPDNYQENLVAYKSLSNGKDYSDLDYLKNITRDIATTTSQLYREVEKKNKKEIMEFFLYQQGYELKWLFDLANMDWRPSKEKLRRIENIQIKKENIIAPVAKEGLEHEKYVGVDFLRKIFQKNIKLSGVIANRGFVVSKVKLIKTRKDFANFKKGDILLTKNTNPSFVEIINKASAIITEQGGITSHGAIIAREFNLPCLVGVKDAISKLSSGDYIELDAYRGELRGL